MVCNDRRSGYRVLIFLVCRKHFGMLTLMGLRCTPAGPLPFMSRIRAVLRDE
jgi:hypothetical protein